MDSEVNMKERWIAIAFITMLLIILTIAESIEEKIDDRKRKKRK